MCARTAPRIMPLRRLRLRRRLRRAQRLVGLQRELGVDDDRPRRLRQVGSGSPPACRSTASPGTSPRRAAAPACTISRSWISPKAPRVCLFDRMSCSPSTSPDSFSILTCALSIVSSRCCSSPRLRAVRIALAAEAVAHRPGHLARAGLHRLRQPHLRRRLRLGDMGDAAVQLLLPVVQRPDRAVEIGEMPRQRLHRPRRARDRPQQDQEQHERQPPPPRAAGRRARSGTGRS